MALQYFKIKEQALRDIFKVISDQLDLLQGVTAASAWRGDVNAGSKKLSNLAEGTAASDAVTLAQLTAATNIQNITTQLQAGGASPINITGLPGTGGILVVGTHADRLAMPSVSGNWFFESDRTALYGVSGTAWLLMSGNEGGSDSVKYTDLGMESIGYLWVSQDLGIMYRWTGAAWRWWLGIWSAAFSTRPTEPTITITSGVRFAASDRGYQEWVYDRGTTTWFYAGGGSPTRDVIANITTGLVTADAGYLFYATDYDRVYRWDGAAWEDAPGQPARFAICWFDTTPDTAGWEMCDGAAVTRSTTSGGTTGYTVPDLTTNTTFLRSGTSVATGTFGTTGVDYNFWRGMPFVRL